MINVSIPNYVTDYILKHANTTENEIIGWLVGFFNEKKEPIVLMAFACLKYQTQTIISANPDPSELNNLTKKLPLGYGVIGMYHSHPRKSKIFHSHVDNDTVVDYASIVDNFLSVVTNGIEIECFMLEDKKTGALKPIKWSHENPEPLKEIQFKFNNEINIPISDSNPNARILTSALFDMIFETWDKKTYYHDSLPWDENKSLKDLKNEKEVTILQINLDSLTNLTSNQKKTIKINDEIHFSGYFCDTISLKERENEIRNEFLHILNTRILNGLQEDGFQWKLGPMINLRIFGIPLILFYPLKNFDKELLEIGQHFLFWFDNIKWNYIRDCQIFKNEFTMLLKTLINFAKLSQNNKMKDKFENFLNQLNT